MVVPVGLRTRRYKEKMTDQLKSDLAVYTHAGEEYVALNESFFIRCGSMKMSSLKPFGVLLFFEEDLLYFGYDLL